ncbi:hypothetical protein Lfu02_00450 [Longispora fulva]|nr:hypothetical protein Lfu02_00450 [Longispora fulva]
MPLVYVLVKLTVVVPAVCPAGMTTVDGEAVTVPVGVTPVAVVVARTGLGAVELVVRRNFV